MVICRGAGQGIALAKGMEASKDARLRTREANYWSISSSVKEEKEAEGEAKPKEGLAPLDIVKPEEGEEGAAMDLEPPTPAPTCARRLPILFAIRFG